MLLFLLLVVLLMILPFKEATNPCAVATWRFGSIAVEKCKQMLIGDESALDAVEAGIKSVELDQRDQYYVGVGGLPNSNGVMELDAAIMDHRSKYGAVMSIQNIESPISVARSVLEKCVHNILCGEGALEWAISNGFKTTDILTSSSRKQWLAWMEAKKVQTTTTPFPYADSHDTVGVICIDRKGQLAVGTSTSGWPFKHPGRVGDSPLIGSGLYCDGKVGAAMATGDGEEIMRCCLSFLVVEFMRQGYSPKRACSLAINRLQTLQNSYPIAAGAEKMHSTLVVGLVAMDITGEVGAASTLSPDNLHRGDAFFPVTCWRDGESGGQSGDEMTIIAASTEGARF